MPDSLTLQYWVTPDGNARHLMLCDHDGPPATDMPGGDGSWSGEQILPGDLPSPAGAGGLLLNLMDVPPSHEDEFNDWYDSEHIPRFGEVEGVICARRFRSGHANPRYAAFYHLTTLDLLSSEAWKQAASTPWTARMRGIRFNNRRLTFVPIAG
ncbi:MAG: hypothetical protein AB7U35_07950 [Sphingobium sp.]